MNKILLVEHIHQAGEAMLARKAQLVFPQPQNVEGILAAIGDCNAGDSRRLYSGGQHGECGGDCGRVHHMPLSKNRSGPQCHAIRRIA